MKKKILRAGCFLFTFVILLLSTQLPSYACSNFVLVTGQTFLTFSGTQYNMYTHNHIYTDEELDCIDYWEDLLNPTILQERSGVYNCYSYAFYSQDAYANNYWMELDGVEAFLDDPHTKELTTPECGCIVVYWTDVPMGEYYDSTYGFPAHSGIVVSVSDNDEDIEVISKWGTGGLYRHTLYMVPDDYVRLVYPEVGDYYIDVKYYRVEAEHTYQYGNPTASGHTKTCTDCGHTCSEGHTFSSMPTGRFRCIYCRYTTATPGPGIASVEDESSN